MEEGTFGPLLHAKFHPHRCNVSPHRGEKPQNRPLSKLNTGRFALRAMLPVTKNSTKYVSVFGNPENKDQLSLTNPRDALHHGKRAVNKEDGRSV